MTAEIAILNRRAVTFAADSAMTISSTGKAYNSADKIFELSTKNPIGLMVYNQLDYMGMPLDVIIKDFRESTYCCNFPHVYDAAEAFFTYLATEFKILGEDEDDHVSTLALSLYMQVRANFFNSVIGNRHGMPHSMFQDTIRDHIVWMEDKAFSDCYFDLTLEDFVARYDAAFDLAINEAFEPLPPLDDDDRLLLKKLGALALQRSYYSTFHTGFVFAGFGSRQLFPALKSFRFDGMVFGRLKKLESEIIAIDANNMRARIVPFAQREMVDRFLFGMDDRHERTIIDNVRHNLEDLGHSIISSLPGIRRETRLRLRENLRRSTDAVLADLQDKTIRELKDESAGETDDAVMFMAKPDLANFAEALVNITSVKRRASLDTESVGGPIDVAVISRDDGFVWVKRKHYFDPSLNPRFFARKYGRVSLPSNGGRS